MMSRLLFFVTASLLDGAIATVPGSGLGQDAAPVALPAAGVRTTAAVGGFITWVMPQLTPAPELAALIGAKGGSP